MLALIDLLRGNFNYGENFHWTILNYETVEIDY